MTTVTGHPRTRAQLRVAIERELSDIFAAHTAAAQAYGSEFTHLWSVAAEHVLGGKLVRPMLMVETYDALTETSSQPARGTRTTSEESAEPVAVIDRATILRLAAAIELLHYSFLLHDDVIDGDLFRRGRRNLIGTLLDDCNGRAGSEAMPDDAAPAPSGRGALHWARTGGILMGDLLLATTHQIFARAELPHACNCLICSSTPSPNPSLVSRLMSA